MKRIAMILLAIGILALTACANQAGSDIPDTENAEEQPAVSDIPQTGWTEAVPAEYHSKVNHPGTVVTLDYDSKNYSGDSEDVSKTTYVYLPYGYDENDTETRYDIIYFMHGFGGFSLGSVTTWMQFCHNSDYIRYFLPMSGSCWYYGGYGDFQIEKNADHLEQLIKDNNLDEKGYFIYFAVGTNDNVKGQSIDFADELLERNDIFTPDHFVFYQMDGGYHDRTAVQEYIYNALPGFFKETDSAEGSERTEADV